MAAKVANGEVEADETVSLPAAIKLSTEIVKDIWQRRWDIAEHGHVTKFFIPKVTTKRIWPTDRCTGISYTRLPLDDTNLEADRFRDRFSESPYCSCDTELETSYHFMMECPLYQEERSTMTNTIQELWERTRLSGNFSITMEVLIGSCYGFQYPKDLVEGIKEATFKFIADTKRKL